MCFPKMVSSVGAANMTRAQSLVQLLSVLPRGILHAAERAYAQSLADLGDAHGGHGKTLSECGIDAQAASCLACPRCRRATSASRIFTSSPTSLPGAWT